MGLYGSLKSYMFTWRTFEATMHQWAISFVFRFLRDTWSFTYLAVQTISFKRKQTFCLFWFTLSTLPGSWHWFTFKELKGLDSLSLTRWEETRMLTTISINSTDELEVQMTLKERTTRRKSTLNVLSAWTRSALRLISMEWWFRVASSKKLRWQKYLLKTQTRLSILLWMSLAT